MNFILIYAILGTFPKAFSQVASSQVYFPKWQLPKCAISQAATSQSSIAAALGSQPVLAAALGPICPFWPLGKFQIWEMANWEIAIWEVALVKMPLEKYLTPIDRWIDR